MGKVVIICTIIFTAISCFAVVCDYNDPVGTLSLASTNKVRLEPNSVREQSAGTRVLRTGFMHGK